MRLKLTKQFNTHEELPDILTLEEVRSYLKLGKVNSYKLLKQKDFPTINISNKIKIPKEEFLQWLKANIEKGEKENENN